jgi:hypothetical protein
MEIGEVKNMKKKVLVLIAVAMMALLATTIIVISQVGAFGTPKPEYVAWIEKEAASDVYTVDISQWTRNNPIIIWNGHMTGASYVNVTVNGVTYTYPKDFSYNFTFHWEFNNVTGYGLGLLHETFTFKPSVIGTMLEDPSTLDLLNEERLSGLVGSFGGLEESGSCQLTGTVHFSSVQGYGVDMYGNSTTFVAQKMLYVKGWPL